MMWKTSEVQFIQNKRPMVMAHRGDSANVPENTYRAFKEAYELGVDVIETDVWMTKDGEFVFHHDRKVNRTTNGSGKVSEYTLEEIQQLDAGYNFTDNEGNHVFRGKGYRICNVDEILSEFDDIRFNMDIKPKDKRAPKLLAERLDQLDAVDRVQVGSFHQKQIKRFRKYSDAPTSAGPFETLRFHLHAKKYARAKKKNSEHKKSNQAYYFGGRLPYVSLTVPESLGPIKVVNPTSIEFAHEMKIAVFVWTINEKERMKKLLDWGVDGLFTDNPKRMLDILRET